MSRLYLALFHSVAPKLVQPPVLRVSCADAPSLRGPFVVLLVVLLYGSSVVDFILDWISDIAS